MIIKLHGNSIVNKSWLVLICVSISIVISGCAMNMEQRYHANQYNKLPHYIPTLQEEKNEALAYAVLVTDID